MPRETLDRLRGLDLPVQYIRGNADRAVLAQMAGTPSEGVPDQALERVRWLAAQLDPDDERFMAGWQMTLRLAVLEIGVVLFCHATPRNDTDIFTRLTPEENLVPVFEGIDAAVVICGHTHMQFDRTIGTKRVLNAGSVGMPYGEPGAHWLLLGPGVQFRRTPYDLAAAAERIRRTAYPPAEEFAAENVLRTPSEAEALSVFTKTELK
jgi:predicted phosphodiesterase